MGGKKEKIMFEKVEKIRQKIFENKYRAILLRICLILAGTLIMSIGFNALYIPNEILSGGISGIAILLNLVGGFEVSLVVALLNIPIFIFGYKFINREFILYSLLGATSLTFFIHMTKGLTFESHELLTTVLLGGVLNGTGLGLVIRAGSSTGGNDIISKVLHLKYSYSIATLNFAFNMIIIGLSIYFFGIDSSIRTLAAMYVSSITTNFIVEGTNYKRTVFIITDKSSAISCEINKQLHRGCTVVDGHGAYTNKDKYMLYTVISINQVAKLKAVVREIDEKAFVNVMESRVVFGKGFVNIKE